jgi:hypothetical protein
MNHYHIEAWLKGKETEQPIEEWVEAVDVWDAMERVRLPDGDYAMIKVTKQEVN